MKSPQRRFVVEFKSGRRLSKARTDSIWGDTDLKALTRQVEDQASHLFGTGETDNKTGVEPVPAGSILVPADEQAAVSFFEPAVDALPDSEAPEASNSVATDAIAEAVPMQIERTAVSPPAKRTKRALRKRSARVSAPTSASPDQQPRLPIGAQGASVSLEELDALEAENKRLRKLLATQLHTQNLQLQKMLARF